MSRLSSAISAALKVERLPMKERYRGARGPRFFAA
jgi:hypothetical protein